MPEYSHQENIDFLFNTFVGYDRHASKKLTDPSGLKLNIASEPELIVAQDGSGISTKGGEPPVHIRWEDVTPFEWPIGHAYTFVLRQGRCDEATEVTCTKGDWEDYEYIGTESPRAIKILEHITASIATGLAKQEFSGI